MKDHFDKIFWFIVGTSAFVCVYIVCITFLQIPKGNERFADTALGFLLGTVLSGGVAYLMGGSAPLNKKPELPATHIDEVNIDTKTDANG